MTANERHTSNPAEDGGREPARGESQPGPTYENPNEGQTYAAPEDDAQQVDDDEENRR